MAVIRAPAGCTSLTVTGQGVVPVTGGLATITDPLTATDICSPYSNGAGDLGLVSANESTGAVFMQFSTFITSITLNATPYAVTNGVSVAIPADRAANFYLGTKNKSCRFLLVSG